MKPALDYIALAFAWLPVSALLACLVCLAWARFSKRHSNEPWLRKGHTASTQTRTRR